MPAVASSAIEPDLYQRLFLTPLLLALNKIPQKPCVLYGERRTGIGDYGELRSDFYVLEYSYTTTH
jgi:hypothetical protein